MTQEMEKNIALSWAMMGVQVERMEETKDRVAFWVSVPEFVPRDSIQSMVQVKNNVLLGGALIQSLTYLMNVVHPVGKKVVFNHTIRVGETWTREKKDQAEKEMTIQIRRAELFGGGK